MIKNMERNAKVLNYDNEYKYDSNNFIQFYKHTVVLATESYIFFKWGSLKASQTL